MPSELALRDTARTDLAPRTEQAPIDMVYDVFDRAYAAEHQVPFYRRVPGVITAGVLAAAGLVYSCGVLDKDVPQKAAAVQSAPEANPNTARADMAGKLKSVTESQE